MIETSKTESSNGIFTVTSIVVEFTDGSWQHLRLHAVAIENHKGQRVEWIGEAIDITLTEQATGPPPAWQPSSTQATTPSWD